MVDLTGGKKLLEDREEARNKAKIEVQIFVKKARFQALVRSGMSPTIAANRMGIKVPVSSRLTAAEVLKMIEEGK